MPEKTKRPPVSDAGADATELTTAAPTPTDLWSAVRATDLKRLAGGCNFRHSSTRVSTSQSQTA